MPRSDAEERAARYGAFEYAFSRTLEQRLDHGLIRTFKPGLDDGPPMRSWASLAEYRKWCDEHLEPWLGYCSPERSRQAVAELEIGKAETASG